MIGIIIIICEESISTECIKPVVLVNKFNDLTFKLRLEKAVFEFIVFTGMNSKILKIEKIILILLKLYLSPIERNRLIEVSFTGAFIIILEAHEASEFNLAIR